MVVFEKKLLFSGKLVVFGQNWLYLGSLVVFSQSSCIHTKRFYSGKVVLFGQKSFVFEEIRCIWAKMVAFGQVGYRANLLYLGKIGCIPEYWLYLGKIGCNRAKWLYAC